MRQDLAEFQATIRFFDQRVGEILAALDELFARYVKEREAGETFGNFTVRVGVVKAVIDAAKDFHG